MADHVNGDTSAVDSAGAGNASSEAALLLNNSDNPGMALVSYHLNEKNYMLWVRGIKIALAAKDKLGYIDGRIPEPAVGDANYERWNKVDNMVHSWILNSISPELREQFMYAANSKNLWDELMQIFGICNGPMVFDLRREVGNLTQGSMSVMAYYSKLKKFWE